MLVPVPFFSQCYAWACQLLFFFFFLPPLFHSTSFPSSLHPPARKGDQPAGRLCWGTRWPAYLGLHSLPVSSHQPLLLFVQLCFGKTDLLLLFLSPFSFTISDLWHLALLDIGGGSEKECVAIAGLTSGNWTFLWILSAVVLTELHKELVNIDVNCGLFQKVWFMNCSEPVRYS